MDSPCRRRFLRLCRRMCGVRYFLDCHGEGVNAADEYGETLLSCLSGDCKLVSLALMLGWQADGVGEGRYPCVHSPLYEACDCGRWGEVLLMLRRPLRREALESGLYQACLAWGEEPESLPALRGLIEQLGGFCPAACPQLLKLLVMGGVYPLIPEALAAGYELPRPESPWWGGDEGFCSSADMRENPAWRRALVRFVAEFRLQNVSCRRRLRLPRFVRDKACYLYTEREWLFRESSK